MISVQVQNSTKSVILYRIALRYLCREKHRKEILYIKLPALVECLPCECYIVSTQIFVEWISGLKVIFILFFVLIFFPKFLQ